MDGRDAAQNQSTVGKTGAYSGRGGREDDTGHDCCLVKEEETRADNSVVQLRGLLGQRWSVSVRKEGVD